MPVTILVEESREPRTGFRQFGVSPAAEEQGRRLGLGVSEIAGRARRAARYRDSVATHRHQDLAFEIWDNTVLGIFPIAG